MRGGLEDFSVSRAGAPWGLPFPIREDGSSAQLPDGSWDAQAGTVYVWFDALTNYITAIGFPDDTARFERYWPVAIHVIGKDINRLHTITWPAMLMSAGLPLPTLVWVHGWLLAPGEQKMSKSRGNFLEPLDFVRAFGQDGARYAVLREAAFDRDTEVSWDAFLRRYNADLANDFGNLLNRTVSMANRYLGGERPDPRSGSLASVWPGVLERYESKLDAFLLHEALAELWTLVGDANRFVDAEQPWTLAKAWKGGDEEAGQRLRDTLGDLIEACRLVGLAAAPFLPMTAPRLLAQLGHDYPYGADGNGGPPLLDELAWGAKAGASGRVGTPEPLFPRLETEVEAESAVEVGAAPAS
jgi:methionyl-tRNA synthetase